MARLNSKAEDLVSVAKRQGWVSTVRELPDAESLQITIEKKQVQRLISCMYSASSSPGWYRIALNGEPDLLAFVGGVATLEQVKEYAQTPIPMPIIGASAREFTPILNQWETDLPKTRWRDSGATIPERIVRDDKRRIASEAPFDQIMMQLGQFRSVTLAQKLLEEKFELSGTKIQQKELESRAEGVAFCVRSAFSYLDHAAMISMSQRIVSLYYGSVALAEAEILASPNGKSSLDEVEKLTKGGHGLFAQFNDDHGPPEFEELIVGPLRNNGFFPQWLKILGIQHDDFSEGKPKKPEDYKSSRHITLGDLMASIPEISTLFLDASNKPPRWVVPSLAPRLHGAGQYTSTLIRLRDRSGRMPKEYFDELPDCIHDLYFVTPEEEDGTGLILEGIVNHPNHKYWWGALPLHRNRNLASSCLILPVFGRWLPYRVHAVVLLYALSILVRYMPGTWQRVVGGPWDHYEVVIESLLDGFSKILPEVFLKELIPHDLDVYLPGSIFS
ncbi:hypothetical protein FRD01_13225 [Microvenator marinus]|uniref:Uncharacterized protein n=1 Tax=Microvenator marinus TaxID=2600177 RepID=A0A5B8XRP1_9DELT|nr:hypothetical protein [Microvenator marinus]QED28175.1 hypothetical protein FRD01_13225 [Microvenator marinus]